MTDKEVILNGIDVSKCEYCLKMTKYRCTIQRDVYKCLCEENPNCYFKQLKRKEQECEELKEDVERWKSNFNGKVSAIEELLHQLDQLKAENEELRRSITKIFACLIKANRTNKIVDTIWVDRITTLWDYIALTLGIEGDQTQIEEQILQKIS